MARAVCRLLLPLLLVAGAAGYEPKLDLRTLDEAIRIGQARDDVVRTRFHRPYRIPVGRPPIDAVDVVTPFRRVELAAEERARIGDRVFRQREALAVLAEHGTALEVFVEATFHPLNVHVGVPDYVVTLTHPDLAAPIAASGHQRIPLFGPRLGGGVALPHPVPPIVPPAGDPLVGGIVIATFDGDRLDPRGTYEVVIAESGQELARVRLDLSGLR